MELVPNDRILLKIFKYAPWIRTFCTIFIGMKLRGICDDFRFLLAWINKATNYTLQVIIYPFDSSKFVQHISTSTINLASEGKNNHVVDVVQIYFIESLCNLGITAGLGIVSPLIGAIHLRLHTTGVQISATLCTKVSQHAFILCCSQFAGYICKHANA